MKRKRLWTMSIKTSFFFPLSAYLCACNVERTSDRSSPPPVRPSLTSAWHHLHRHEKPRSLGGCSWCYTSSSSQVCHHHQWPFSSSAPPGDCPLHWGQRRCCWCDILSSLMVQHQHSPPSRPSGDSCSSLAPHGVQWGWWSNWISFFFWASLLHHQPSSFFHRHPPACWGEWSGWSFFFPECFST